MLAGTADLETLAARAGELATFDAEPLVLEDVVVLQVACEIASAGACDLLPPALHPTLPPLLSWLCYRCPASPWGAFTLAQVRLECRTGTRPRGFLLAGACDSPDAAAALGSRWAYTLECGDVELRRGYDAARAIVALGGEPVLDVGLRDPEPLAPGDLQYVAGMHLSHTPSGLRLVQVDPGYAVERAERGEPVIDAFDAAAWGDARLEPVYPVSASLALARLTLPRLRFICRPDVPAFEGTERIA